MAHVIFQYGTAFHLAVLTVAPLFLQAFFGPSLHAAFLTWLAVFAALWVVMNPSARMGEWPRDARHRIGWELAHDPFLLFGVIALVIAAIRAINGGVALTYDITAGMWHLKGPQISVLPGSVSGTGLVPLAGTLGLVVVTLGVRHALNSAARLAYLVLSSFLAVLTAALWWAARRHGIPPSGLTATPADPSGLGTVLGVFFLFAVATWTVSWTRRGSAFELLSVLPVGALLAALFVTAPTPVLWGFLPVGIAIFLTGALLTVWHRRPFAWARTAVFLLLALLPVALLVTGEIARPALWPVFTKGFLALREAASSVAVAGWKSSTQLGLGLGSYPFALGFHATADDWRALTMSQVAAPNGYFHLLFEQGLLGAAVLLAGLAILLRDAILRYVRAGSDWRLTTLHLVGPFVLLAVGAVLAVDCSFVQPEALMPLGAALGLTAASFPHEAEEDYG